MHNQLTHRRSSALITYLSQYSLDSHLIASAVTTFMSFADAIATFVPNPFLQNSRCVVNVTKNSCGAISTILGLNLIGKAIHYCQSPASTQDSLPADELEKRIATHGSAMLTSTLVMLEALDTYSDSFDISSTLDPLFGLPEGNTLKIASCVAGGVHLIFRLAYYKHDSTITPQAQMETEADSTSQSAVTPRSY